MGKKKNRQPRHKYYYTFIVGVLLGFGLHWLPIDRDFSPALLDSSEWQTEQPLTESLVCPVVTPIIHRQDYSLAYDARTKNAAWVYTKFTGERSKENLKRKDCDFREDPLIPKHLRATNRDYKESGFDRGHLSPAADASSQESLQETFYLSNIAPQDPQFNRGYWKKLEHYLRELTENYETLHVFVGPLYLQNLKHKGLKYVKYQVIGENQVAVPTHFFAVVFVEDMDKKLFAKSYILPNRPIAAEIPLNQFLSTLEKVERLSGILFSLKNSSPK